VKNKTKTFDRSFWIYIIIFSGIIILIGFLPSLIISVDWINYYFSKTGQIGETIGGIMGPFIAIAAAILTFFAFWVQYKANEQQRHDIAKERFESKFYELLRMHRQNVEGTKIEGLEQREVFQELYYELRTCYNLVDEAFTEVLENNQFYLNKKFERKKINLAYIIFFYGFGNSSTFINNQTTLPESEWLRIYKKLEETIGNYNSKWIKSDISIKDFKFEQLITDSIPRKFGKYLNSYYRPFSGQSQLLSHYYRNIFQIVKFIDSDKSFLTNIQKYEYIKTLRAQLSDFEQLLLYFNALSNLGSKWLDGNKESLIIKYKMVKNIPLNMIFGIPPIDIFSQMGMNKKDIDDYFEWNERLLKE
jgi:hypothetical protein